MKRIEHKVINGVEMKRCSKCKEFRALGFFSMNKTTWDCLQSDCKLCKNRRAKEYYADNNEAINEQRKKCYETNPEIFNERNKAYRKANPEVISEYNKKWKIANPDKVKVSGRKSNAKRRSTLKGRLNSNMASAINHSLHGNKAGRHWEALVGYSLEDLIKHLEKEFTDGMSWANRDEWHLDHKIPQSVANFTKPEHEDFRRCWALKNLQPMWAVENISKSDKLTKHFQPSLLM